MKQAEYMGEVMEDGHLSLPESVRKQLGLEPSALVQVTVAVPETDQTAGTRGGGSISPFSARFYILSLSALECIFCDRIFSDSARRTRS